MPRSSALWTTFVVASKSTRPPKLLQPSPTTDTRRPDRPRLRCSTNRPLSRSDASGRQYKGFAHDTTISNTAGFASAEGSYKLLVGHERELAPKDRNRS